MSTTEHVPNHHAHHPGFSGVSGLLTALTMTVGRSDVARLAADLVGLTEGDRLVDVGCGPGSAARFAQRRGATVVGVDPSSVMLDVARTLSVGRRIDWRVGSAEALPVDDGVADVVWSLASVHHWTDIDVGAHEVQRVLALGGRFVAIERQVAPGATGHASHGWQVEQGAAFGDVLTASGFDDVEVVLERAGREQLVCVRATGPSRTRARR